MKRIIWRSCQFFCIKGQVTQEIKDYIKKNIDLLPREIYARLIAEDLDTSIRANQIHFWWTQIGQNRTVQCFFK